jgi:hypothetical protein
LISTVLKELEQKRVEATISQGLLASARGTSQSSMARVLTNQRADIGLIELSEVASVLGMELFVRVYPIGDPVRDKGQLAAGRRFDACLSGRWLVMDEAPVAGPGDERSWDKSLRLKDAQPTHVVGVDIESRVHDIQAIVRRTRLRERDGRADAILIVLSDTAHNRRIVDDLRHSLGESYATPPRVIMRALREGSQLLGSGVVLI